MHRRYEFSALVKIGKPLEASDAFAVPECMEAHVSDLGKRGCFVTTTETLPVGANVSARIIQEKKTCDVRARVVYSLPGHGMGLLFTDAESRTASHTGRLARGIAGSFMVCVHAAQEPARGDANTRKDRGGARSARHL